MVGKAGSGHPGGSLSAADIMAALYFGDVLKVDPANPAWPDRDRFVLTKGHAAPIHYSRAR
jgi:transketolase